jgi:hypothetical protein
MTFRSHLIYRHTDAGKFLTWEDVQARAPAVFGECAAEGVSKRYEYLNSKGILDLFADNNLYPVFARQVEAKDKALTTFKEHVVAFRPANQDVRADALPEVIYYNGHDGKSSVRLYAGLYRFICSNESVLGDGWHSRAYHIRNHVTGVEDLIRDILSRLDDIPALIERYRGVKVDHETAFRIARGALELRWPGRADEKNPRTGKAVGDTSYWQTLGARLFDVRREADLGWDGWTVYNRVQESIVRGRGLYLPKWDKLGSLQTKRVRPLNSIKEGLRVNRGLFDLFERELFGVAPKVEVFDAEFIE